MSLNPISAFIQTHRYLLAGRLHFPRARVGERITMDDGRTFTVFRQVVVDPTPNQPARPGAVFRVRFHVASMSPAANKRFSWLPVPFFVGLPGFRSKLWMLDEATGDFQGLYEWDTIEDAESYARSFAMRFMTRRAVPGSTSHRVTPQ